MTFVD